MTAEKGEPMKDKPKPIKAAKETLVGEKGFLRGASEDQSSSRLYLGVTLLFTFAWFSSNLWGPWNLWLVVVPDARDPKEFELVFIGALVLYFTAGAYGKDAMRYVLPQFGAILERMGGGSSTTTWTRLETGVGSSRPRGGDDPIRDDESDEPDEPDVVEVLGTAEDDDGKGAS